MDKNKNPDKLLCDTFQQFLNSYPIPPPPPTSASSSTTSPLESMYNETVRKDVLNILKSLIRNKQRIKACEYDHKNNSTNNNNNNNNNHIICIETHVKNNLNMRFCSCEDTFVVMSIPSIQINRIHQYKLFMRKYYEFKSSDNILNIPSIPVPVPKGIIANEKRFIEIYQMAIDSLRELEYMRLMHDTCVTKIDLIRNLPEIKTKKSFEITSKTFEKVAKSWRIISIIMDKILVIITEGFVLEIESRIPLTFHKFVGDIWLLKRTEIAPPQQQQQEICSLCTENIATTRFTSCECKPNVCICEQCACTWYWNSSVGCNKLSAMCPLCKKEWNLDNLVITANQHLDVDKFLKTHYDIKTKVELQERRRRQQQEINANQFHGIRNRDNVTSLLTL